MLVRCSPQKRGLILRPLPFSRGVYALPPNRKQSLVHSVEAGWCNELPEKAVTRVDHFGAAHAFRAAVELGQSERRSVQ